MAGLGPAIHAFAASTKRSRGWPAFADHDDLCVIIAPIGTIIPAARTNDLPLPLVPFVMAGLVPAIHVFGPSLTVLSEILFYVSVFWTCGEVLALQCRRDSGMIRR
jgi:hypothetical protein